MRPSIAFECLKVLVYCKLPGFLWGDPGVCKSSLMKALTEYFFSREPNNPNTINWQLKDERAVLKDPTDVKGLPAVNGDSLAHWCPPADYPRSGYGVFFIDELPNAAPLTQSAYLQLTLDRKVGEYELPDGWCIFAAGNPERTGAAVHRMSSALANRFIHIPVEPNTEDWIEWAKRIHSNDRIEFKPIKFEPITAETRSFITFRPEQLHNFNGKNWNMAEEKAFPSPRTNEFADIIMQACDQLGTKPEIRRELLYGCCGKAWAKERLAFREMCKELPDPVATLEHPDQAAVPTEPSTLVAFTAALVDRLNEDNAENFMKYAMRLPEEFRMKMVKDAERNKEKRHFIINTVGYIKYATDHPGKYRF